MTQFALVGAGIPLHSYNQQAKKTEKKQQLPKFGRIIC